MVKITEFQEDMIFKNTSEEDVNIVLEIMGQEKSKTVKIWKEELRLLDPTTYKPDLIIEMDDKILV